MKNKEIELTASLKNLEEDMNMTSCEAYGEVDTKDHDEEVQETTSAVYERVN